MAAPHLTSRQRTLEVNCDTPLSASVRVVRSVSEAEQLRDTWTRWTGHRDSQIDFFLDFIRSRDEVVRPHIIVLSRGSRPEAMLIGRLERTRVPPKIGYLQLGGIPVRCLTFVYGGLRGDASDDNCRWLLRSVVESLGNSEADVALLHHPNTNSSLYRQALQVPSFASRDHAPQPAAHFFMRLPESINAVFQQRSHDHRKELRRKSKKLLAAFGDKVAVKCYRDKDQLKTVI